MNAYIYFMVLCISMANGQSYCMPVGNPFVGDNPAAVCAATQERVNKTAPQNYHYYCVRRKEWEQD